MAHLSKAQKQDALRASPVFAGADPDTLEALAELMQVETFEEGELVCGFGEEADRVFVLASGEVSVRIPGREGPVRRLGEGATIGEYGLAVGGLRTASVEAERPCLLLSLDNTRFRAFLMTHPEALMLLFTTAVERLLELEARSRRD